MILMSIKNLIAFGFLFIRIQGELLLNMTFLMSVGTQLCLKGRKEMFYLTTHSTHFIYDYMASDI